MCVDRNNIYRLSRENAKLTLEQASELLNISPRSLHDYEEGKTSCCSLVLSMSKIYNSPILPTQHLTSVCEIGKECLPRIEKRDLPTAVIHLCKELKNSVNLSDDLFSAACEKTKESLDATQTKVIQMVAAGLSCLNALLTADIPEKSRLASTKRL